MAMALPLIVAVRLPSPSSRASSIAAYTRREASAMECTNGATYRGGASSGLGWESRASSGRSEDWESDVGGALRLLKVAVYGVVAADPVLAKPPVVRWHRSCGNACGDDGSARGAGTVTS